MVKEKTEKRRSLLLPILIAVVLAACALALILNGGKIGSLDFGQKLTGVFKSGGADSFYYDAGENAAFGDMDGGLAVASSTGLLVLDRDGKETLREVFVMSAPTLDTAGSHAAAYDLGGTELRKCDSGKVTLRLKTDYPIICADVSDSGSVAVCTGASGYKGLVTVYDADGDAVFKWYSGEGYVLAAALDKNGTDLAVLTLTGSGSRITRLRTNDESYSAADEFDGVLMLDVAYTQKGNVAALTDEALYLLYGDGTSAQYDFGGRYLNDYSLSGGFIALSLQDYKSGGGGAVVVLDEKAREKGAAAVSGVLSLSCSDGCAAVLTGGGLTIYDGDMNACAEHSGLSGYTSVIMRGDGTAAAVSGHFADVFRSGGE